MYDDSPDEMIHDLFTSTMWSGSNLGEPTIGYADTVSALTSDDLRNHLRLRYAPNTVVFAAAGNVDHDAIVALAVDVLADMFLHSVFAPDELRKEQKVVLEEIRMYDDSPDE
ncbi:MAG: insulinase family protein, partial [Candidatus Eremiobacteraeota bacterium]|nr:insulinase family protein [Candidatus Eremiobacteraeota bacterium]